MDVALALLIAMVELDLRYRMPSALLPSVTGAEVVALTIVMAGGLVGLAARPSFAGATLRSALADARVSALYLASLPCVAAAGLAAGSAEGVHALKDAMPGAVLLVLCLVLPATAARLDRAEVALSAVGLSVALLAVAQSIWGGPYVAELSPSVLHKRGWDAWGSVGHPVVGPFAHPNGLALFLVPIGILAAGRASDAIRDGRAWRIGIIHAGCAVGAIVAVIVGGAKMGAGTLLVGVAARAVLGVARIRCTPGRAAGALVMVLAALATMIAAALGLATHGTLDISAGTLVERWLLNVSAVRFLGDHPDVLAIGGGLTAFIESKARDFQVHNEFLGQILRLGLVSGILFVGMIGSAFRGLDRGAWSNALALCGLVAMLLVEPAGGSQAQGLILTLLGLCALRRRVTAGP